MVCGMEMGPCAGKETGELALLRQLLDHLDPNDILLTDRYFLAHGGRLTYLGVAGGVGTPTMRQE